MEDSHIRRLPHEFWTDYLVRRLKSEGLSVPINISTNSDGDGEISYVMFDREIKTNKGEVGFNKMIDFNMDVFDANKKSLEQLSFAGHNEYFLINERDEGEKWAYRQFGFIVEDDIKATVQDHSSCWKVPNHPGRNSWKDVPLIEKYKDAKRIFYPKILVDDVIRYIKDVGVAFDKPKNVESRKRSIVPGPSLGISQIQTYEIPSKDEDED